MDTNMSDSLAIIFYVKENRINCSSLITMDIVVWRLYEAWFLPLGICEFIFPSHLWKYLYSITEFWIRYVHRNEMSPFGCLLSSDPYSFHLQRHLWKLPASHAIGAMFWKSKKSTLCAFIEWTVHLFACVFVCSIPLPFRCVR